MPELRCLNYRCAYITIAYAHSIHTNANNTTYTHTPPMHPQSHKPIHRTHRTHRTWCPFLFTLPTPLSRPSIVHATITRRHITPHTHTAHTARTARTTHRTYAPVFCMASHLK